MIKAVRPLLLLSVALYAACLTQTAFCWFNDRVICMSSLDALVTGFITLPWWANPLLFVGWALLLVHAPIWLAFPYCAVGLALGSSHLQVIHSNGWTGGKMFSHNEGYWLWLASIGVATIACLLLPWNMRKRTTFSAWWSRTVASAPWP